MLHYIIDYCGKKRFNVKYMVAFKSDLVTLKFGDNDLGLVFYNDAQVL
jgi:hypothetical protein